MKYSGILLDIDHTLYNYHHTHQIAMDAVASEFDTRFGIGRSDFEDSFGRARKEVHLRLSGTASSHNRILYFQRTFELLGLNAIEQVLDIYHLYWDTFLNSMKVYEGVYELLETYRNKVCFVTDLTAHIQHRKVQRLRLYKYTSLMVTSEEAGIEKPHAKMFEMGLAKLRIGAHEACMIGDSLSKDITGAEQLAIRSIWLNSERKTPETALRSDLISEVHSFREILDLV